MKKKSVLFISILLALALSSCGRTLPSSISDIPSSETPSSLSSSELTSSKESSVPSSSSISSIFSSLELTSSSELSTSEVSSSSELSSSSEITSSSELLSSSSEESSSSEPISSSSEQSSSSSELPPEDVYVDIELFALNDLHGNVIDSDSGLGISKTSTLLKTYPNNVNNALYISQGDMWQGGAESNITKGNLVTEWMNQLEFTSMTIGNHEFDWSTSYIEANRQLADFPFLGINVYDRNTNQRVNYLDPSVVINKNGAKIGIIGAIGDCYTSIASSVVSGVYFKVGYELTNLVKQEAIRLRNEEQCDFIIYSIHDDDSYYDVELSNYVDIVFEGHTHQNYIRTDSKGVYHIQSAGYNKTINYINLTINTTKDTFVINRTNSIYTSNYDYYDNDSQAESLFTKYANVINGLYDVIGYNAYKRGSGTLRNLVAKLYLQYGQQAWGSQYNIFLGGGYLSCRSPYYLYEGDVNYAQLYTLFPFDNYLTLCSVKGSDLNSVFINTTESNYYMYYSDYGNNNMYNVDSNATYYVVVDSYTSTWAPNNLTEVERYSVSDFYARDMLAEFARAGGFMDYYIY